jgi:hypothetical protein
MAVHELATAGLASMQTATLEAIEGGAALGGWTLLGCTLATTATVRHLRGRARLAFGQVSPRPAGVLVRLLASVGLGAVLAGLAHLSRH